MNPLPILRAAASMLVLLLAGHVAAAPSAQLFDAVKKPEALDADWRARLCALLPQPCDPQALGLYRPRGAVPGDYAVFSSEPLAMARIRRVAATGTWQLNRLHDFSGYAAASMKKAAATGMAGSRISLAPALYPLAEGRWAAAVLQTVSEMYSGGGASFSKADFVPLEDASRAVYEGIPFSCSKMIRACFSEKEYKQSKHCHDESSGSLRISYGEAASPGEAYSWQYTWLQSEWPQNTPASDITTTRLHFTARTTERASFCGGPQ